MLLVVDHIKNAWRAGKVAAALFLDVQGAFPNTVKDQLLHNMKLCQVPTCFVNLITCKLTGRSTWLWSTQWKAAKTITGSLSTAAGDMLDAHANLFLIDLLFSKLLFRAALHLCLLPKSHPLHLAVWKAAHCPVKQHQSPLHNLLQLAKISPDDVKTISATCRSPGYVKAFNTFICNSKEQALLKVDMLKLAQPIQVFCDRSSFEGRVRASAVLYVNNRVDKILHFHLGSKKHHQSTRLKVSV